MEINKKKLKLVKPKMVTTLIKQPLKKTMKYFKCFECPMVAHIEINNNINTIKISCENGHETRLKFDQFLDKQTIFSYTCSVCGNTEGQFNFCSIAFN